MEHVVKLPIGKKNIVIKRCKVGYAEGVRKPKRPKKSLMDRPFNTPVIKIRSAV